MLSKRTDTDTGIVHIIVDNSKDTLCGVPYGYTRKETPVKEKWQTTCEDCQSIIRAIKHLSVN